MTEELGERLLQAVASRDFSGLLFHGTGETLVGDLRPSSYDGLFWTADTPAVAQSYIPASGASQMYSAPSSTYDLEMRVRPQPHSLLLQAARQMSGLEPIEVEFDQYGRLKSWRLPPDWPTVAEAVAWLETLGYPAKGTHWVRMEKDIIQPADFLRQGTLVVLPSQGLRFKDIRRGIEGDLTDVEYHGHAAFSQAREEGYDGVLINDFAQTDEGNVGHWAWGIFDHALERTPRLLLPCVRSSYDDWAHETTSDVERWAAARGIETSPAMAM